MPIYSQHPEYKETIHKWELVRAIVKNNAHKYLYPFEDTSSYQRRVYQDQAVLMNFTSLTKNGLTGLVFRKPSTIQVPGELDYLLPDVTGTGFSIDQFGQFGIGEILQTGRLGLLVDFPKREGTVSVLDEDRQGLKARIVPYPSESIINWQTQRRGSRTFLTMIVLRELRDEMSEDGFEWIEKEYYRVLQLNDAGYYIQYVADRNGDLVEDVVQPADGAGNFLTEIPFIFAGSANNDWYVDHPPLYDLAKINLAHYRNSADLEENIRIHGQATLVLGGEMDIESFKENYGDTLALGSNKAYYLGMSPHAQLLQAGPNQMVSQEMKRKEDQAAAIGARLIAPAGGRETAEAARIRYGSQNSALHTLTSNMSMAVTDALKWCAVFMNAPINGIVYELNRKFYEEKADPNLIAQQIMMLQNGIIAKEDVRQYLRETNVIGDTRTDSDIESDVEIEFDPLMGIGNNDNRD